MTGKKGAMVYPTTAKHKRRDHYAGRRKHDRDCSYCAGKAYQFFDEVISSIEMEEAEILATRRNKAQEIVFVSPNSPIEGEVEIWDILLQVIEEDRTPVFLPVPHLRWVEGLRIDS